MSKKLDLSKVPEAQTQRLLTFVYGYEGGPSEVARLIGSPPARFYSLASGRNKKASQDMFDKMRECVPGFDYNYIVSGESDSGVTSGVNATLLQRVKQLEEELKNEKKKSANLEGKLEDWQKAYRSITEQYAGVDRPGVKIGPDNRSTAKPPKTQELQRRAIGF